MSSKIPWIPDAKGSKFNLPLPIDTKGIIKYLKSMQNAKGFYISLEETFWAIIVLMNHGEFPETAYKDLISFVLKHRVESGAYSNKIKGEYADIWSTFYAIALFDLLGVFKKRLENKKLFCTNCGQKQLFVNETCFKCGTSLVPDKIPCVICNRVIQHSPPENIIWDNLCNICHEILLTDIKFILSTQTKKGFTHCKLDKCIICEGKPTYKSTFFAINSLSLLNCLDQLDKKSMLIFLNKNQYTQEIERIFQLLSYYLLDIPENIDYTVLLENIIPFQQSSGFGIGKKIPAISDTFWSIVPFYLYKKLDLIQLGSIPTFLEGLKRGDGGYSEQIMDTMSNIFSSVQAFLITLIIFDPLVDQIEDAILKECISGNRIYLAPISKKILVSIDFVESVAHYLLSTEWFNGKIFDQLDFFTGYLEKSNVITQKIGKSLIKAVQNQSEIKLAEFSKKFDFDNAEERIKTVIINFLANKFLEGEICKIKKHFMFCNINLPRKFIWLSSEKPIPVAVIFKEKAQLASKHQLIITNFHQLLFSLKSIEEEIITLIEQNNPDKARNKLDSRKNEFINEVEEFEHIIIETASKFKYKKLTDIMASFFAEWPTNKKTLILTMNKLQEKLTSLIEKKEKSIAYDTLISKEQRLFKNFEEYLRVFSEKVGLVIQEFEINFSEHYKDQNTINIKINELNKNFEGYRKDLKVKTSKLDKSIEISQKPEIIEELSDLLNTKFEHLKEKIEESTKIVSVREQIPKQFDETIQNFKDQLVKNQIIINEKIENKEFDSASKEIESQDMYIKNFKIEIRQNLEEIIKENKAQFTHFTISFEDLRVSLNEKLIILENEWNTKKEEILTKFLEKTELSKKNQLKKKMEDYIKIETEKFESLKQDVDNLIKHENMNEANAKLKNGLSKFNQTTSEFEIEINNYIKLISKQFKNFK
ncbi:MAG: hypothetical protein ACFFD2_19510, partial [Promethearchaeota archaeon]